ncbi:filamentous hemagglutinin family protein [Orrella sp. JC864]|uniref:filamentous haemagglutinin family protein n=1 Tax=Orrella sp. JC864 TaxID=3120298 RepID=UPI00300A9476
MLWSPGSVHAAAPGANWFAAGAGAGGQARAAQRAPAPGATLPTSARQQAQAREQLSRSIANLNRTANAIAAQQAAQEQVRSHAQNAAWVRDGLGADGLDRLAGGRWDAAAPETGVKDGRQQVTITQDRPRAILEWNSFHVGRNTDLTFRQASTDAVLNKVMGDARPSQIQGSIHADGTVMIANQNGVVFTGSSQVNVRNLVAAAAATTGSQGQALDAQFLARGLYSEGGTPTFQDALGNIEVQAGARLATHAPGSVTEGGGYVLLLGREAHNAGQISTPRGQTLLAAGDEFFIRKGYGTEANSFSTTRGNEVAPGRVERYDDQGNPMPSVAGLVTNTGLITAREGDITLTGHDVRQAGVVVATTSVNTRGTIHLLNSASDAQGRVTLGEQATTAILLQDDGQTALDSQRQALIEESARRDLERVAGAIAPFDNLSTLPDRREQSRIEIVSGQHVDFAPGSLTLATGGQVAVSAQGRAQVQGGATLDVSGAVGVRVAMEGNNLRVNIQGNEQRDAPVNRDSGQLNNLDVWVDRRSLVFVPAGTGGYESDRWYTAGGLLEVGGYLGNQAHTIGEWAAQGGTVTLGATEVVTQRGAMVNIAGGTLDVQDGYINQSWLRGADGRLYTVSDAPADMLYEGLYRGYARHSERWGRTDTWYNPLVAPRRRWEAGYTVGRDAGRLVISAPGVMGSGEGDTRVVTAVLEGDIDASVYQGSLQDTRANAALADAYLQSQRAVARRGEVALVSQRYNNSDSPLREWEAARHVRIANGEHAPLTFEDAFDEAFAGTVHLDAGRLNDAQLGSLLLRATESASLAAPLVLAAGGELAVHAASIDVAADVTARAGAILLTNVRGENLGVLAPAQGRPAITVQPGVTLDTRGLWTNYRLDAQAGEQDAAPGADVAGPDEAGSAQAWRLAYIDGGSVTLRSSGDVTLSAGSVIDASAGGAILANGGMRGGAGGDIALVASHAWNPSADRGNHGDLTLDGTVVSRGFTRGGRLTLQTGGMLSIGGQVGGVGGTLAAGTPAPYELVLAADTPIPAGTVLPVDATIKLDTVPPGGTLPSGYWSFANYGMRDYKDFNGNGDTEEYLVTQADWADIPVQMNIIDRDGLYRTIGQGQVLPAGSQITGIFGNHIGMYAITFPADVFPQGVPIRQDPWTAEQFLSVPLPLTAGSPAPMDVSLPAGTVLPQGTVAALDMPVRPLRELSLAPSFFQSGFSGYAVNGQSALVVTAGTQVRASMPVYHFDDTVRLTPTGADLAHAASFSLDPVYIENPDTATLTQRGGTEVGLYSVSAIGSKDATRSGTAIVQEGAAVEVDPGSRIAIASGGQIEIHGVIAAPGGDIAIVNESGFGESPVPASMHPGGLSLWIGERAVLDAAGRVHVARDRYGRRYGVAPGGGRITLGSEGGQYRLVDSTGDAIEPGNEQSTHAYVVLRPGSVLDVSGASATLDLPVGNALHRASMPAAIYGDGGSIALRSYSGIHANGVLRAFGGGPGAAGGELVLTLESPILPTIGGQSPDTPAFMLLRAPRVLTVGQAGGGYSLPEDAAPGQAAAGLALGQATIGADQVAAGGFDALTLRARDAIVFDGDVSLSMGRSLALKSGQYANRSAGTVALAAPHVLLQGQTGMVATNVFTLPDQVPHYTQDGTATGAPRGAAFSVSGKLVDISNAVQIVYADTRIASSGDLRLLSGGSSITYNPANWENPYSTVVTPTFLTSVGALTLVGERIYAASGARVTVQAGYSAGQNRPSDAASPSVTRVADVVLTLGRPEGAAAAPATPYSAFADMTFSAGDIVQGGMLYAPHGVIRLSASKMGANQPAAVRLLSGSITSASGQGLVMPYGGTTDGTTWMVDGAAPVEVDLVTGEISQSGFAGQSTQGVSITATHIQSESGAFLDLSGGGELTGAAFVPGRGGSVDRLLHPFNEGGQVYAIVPGSQGAAPVAGGYAGVWSGDVPGVGQQITIPEGVPGLPAGTYTLMPANYALVPGAYRVELGGAMTTGLSRAVALRNGTWLASGYQGVAGTAIRDALPTRVTFMPGQTVRRYSRYNETSYAEFLRSRADSFSTVRPGLEADGKSLVFTFSALDTALADAAAAQAPALQWEGQADLGADRGGYGGALALRLDGPQGLVITGDTGSNSFRSLTQTVLKASDINAIGAPSVFIGGTPSVANGDPLQIMFNGVQLQSLVLEAGATLTGGQVFLNATQGGTIRLESGSGIDTRGYADVALRDSSLGYFFGGGLPMVAVSNGQIDLSLNSLQYAAGTIHVSDGAAIRSRGGISFLSRDGVSLEGSPKLAAPSLDIAAASINLGSAGDLAAAQAAGVLPAGFNLDQQLVERLVAGDPGAGLPGVRHLKLTTNTSFNVYGSVNLALTDGAGRPLLDSLTFTTPAIYGAGGEGDRARLSLDTFIWNTPQRVASTTGDGRQIYDSALPGATIAGGPGQGQGALEIDARVIEVGHLPRMSGGQSVTFDHLMLGFSDVTLRASEQITSRDRNTLSLWQSGPDPSAAFDPAAYAGAGGNLTLVTPLLTAGAGGDTAYRAGGTLTLRAPEGVAPASPAHAADTLGGRIALFSGGNLLLDTAIVLPSGRLAATAEGGITLGANSRLDLAGRAIGFFDVVKHTWGGDVLLESAAGDIVQQAGSLIDVSAAHNAAGTVQLTATGEGAGRVVLDGALMGAGVSSRDGGRLDVRAQVLGNDAAALSASFATLNNALNEGGFTGARSFGIKQGSLVISDALRAHEVVVSADGGSLTVTGRIDASGQVPGIIRLAARDDLVLAGTAVLDARGTELQVDGYGQAIHAKNRGHIELASRGGWLRLQAGSRMDLSSPDGVNRGQVELNAGRTGETSGDLRIQTDSGLAIAGARGIFLNAVQRYELAGGSVIDQALLDGYDTASQAFIAAAYGGNVAGGSLSAGLQGKLAGLTAYGGAFHLRPGVEITSEGDLSTSGDIDLSGYRYGPQADRDLASARYGAGEAMSLVVRAGGDLDIQGSISDGFKAVVGMPPTTEVLEGLDLGDTRYFTFWGGVWFYPDGYHSLGAGFPAVVTDPAGWTVPYLPDGSPIPWNILPANSADEWTALKWESGTHIPYGTLVYSLSIPVGMGPAFAGLSVQTDPGRPSYQATHPLATMLAPGSQSATLRLVAGADLQATFSRTLRAASVLDGRGSLRLSDPHANASGVPIPSVVRTGTGALDLLAGGDIEQQSLYGIYTAGADTGAVGLPEGAYLPDYGGDLTLAAQGDVSGYNYVDTSGVNFQSLSNWLIRQGGAGANAAWAIRFGATLLTTGWSASPYVGGFAGIGTLGGGNVTLLAGGNAGAMSTTRDGGGMSEYESLMLVVGASGQVTSVTRDGDIVTGGTLNQAGGGDLRVKVGGVFNGGDNRGNWGTQSEDGSMSILANMRGAIDVGAGSIGGIQPLYTAAHAGDPRGLTSTSAYAADPVGGISLLMGDSAATVRTAGDLVLGSVADAGHLYMPDSTSYFALWQPQSTSLTLFAAGGNLVPHTGSGLGGNGTDMLPGSFAAVAASGSLYYGGYYTSGSTLTVAPSPRGNLELLARDSIYGAGLAWGNSYTSAGTIRINVSGAGWGPNDIPNPFRPVHTTSANYHQAPYFIGQTPVRYEHAGDPAPIRIYAVTGDIQSVSLGETAQILDTTTYTYSTQYIAAKSARILAGRDIVNFGAGTGTGGGNAAPGLIMNVHDTDVSLIQAGRDIFHLNVDVAGPGSLDVIAAGNIYQGDRGSINSIGPVVPGDTRPGASIAVMAGAGAAGADYAAFAARYLDPANQADTRPGYPLADQPGKVAYVYDEELIAWLTERYGSDTGLRFADDGAPVVFDPDTADPLAFFQRLAPEQQRIFLRQVYFAELRAGGREYNDADGPRFGSYLRGRQAIAALFPEEAPVPDAQGQPVLDADGLPLTQAIARGGNFTMFGGSGIRTLYGGDIHMLVPAGQTLVGVEGLVPPASAGVVTQGKGEIGMYSQGSILLGLSRIMTTFGGGITAWSAQGDINAGRGAKTTIVYTPPRRVYDAFGNVTLSPDVPSTGAGIATLNPIPEVPPGDVDLIAPLGTIDAGEAGIRVSGNVNIAALQVVNAANIQVQGEAAGIPVVAAVNVGALTSASAASTAAADAAQESVARSRAAARQNLPSIISVQILGFGDEPAAGGPAGSGRADPQAGNALQVLGDGPLAPAQAARLTVAERQRLGR